MHAKFAIFFNPAKTGQNEFNMAIRREKGAQSTENCHKGGKIAKKGRSHMMVRAG